MSEVLVFQHDPLEDLGFFVDVLRKQKMPYRVLQLTQGELPAEGWNDVDGLIVLGGGDTAEYSNTHSSMRWESRIIRAAVDENVPVLGISSGAHLVASALGASSYAGAVREIGWSPISITPHGQVDSLLGYLPENATVFQWHRCGFALPQGAIRLASSSHYENQAFRLGRNVYGLQFHLEVTPEMIVRWIDERSKDLALAPYVSAEKILADTQNYAETLK